MRKLLQGSIAFDKSGNHFGLLICHVMPAFRNDAGNYMGTPVFSQGFSNPGKVRSNAVVAAGQYYKHVKPASLPGIKLFVGGKGTVKPQSGP